MSEGRQRAQGGGAHRPLEDPERVRPHLGGGAVGGAIQATHCKVMGAEELVACVPCNNIALSAELADAGKPCARPDPQVLQALIMLASI